MPLLSALDHHRHQFEPAQINNVDDEHDDGDENTFNR